MTEPSSPVIDLQGGCLCGALRFRVTAPAVKSGYCHCRMCQKNSGAPVSAFADIPIAHFAFIEGEPATYRSSAWGCRQFCAKCGSWLLYRDVEGPKTISLNTASLDDPSAFPPTHHIFTASRIAWFETTDELPRYPDKTPS